MSKQEVSGEHAAGSSNAQAARMEEQDEDRPEAGSRAGVSHESLSRSRSSAESGEGGMGKAQRAMGNAMSATGRIGGDVSQTATGLVRGVGNIGGEVVSVVRDTANTAIIGVGSIGETAVHALTGILVGVVSGMREVGSAAMRGKAARTEAAHSERQPEETLH